jgi:AraC-like DNA-binding protein
MSKKVLTFNVPQTEQEIVRVQTDSLPHFYDQLHQHPEIQVMWIQSGEGTLIAGDYVGRFHSGDVFILGSGLPHVFRSDESYYTNDIVNTARSVSLYFSEKYFGKELWNSNELKNVRELAATSQQGLQLTPFLAPMAIRLIDKLPNCGGLEKMITFLSLLELLVNESKYKKLSLKSGNLHVSEEGRMNSIVEFTFKESHRKIYITEVAQRANLSVEAFCRYFKLHTRKTYINFLHEVRISHACQLLINRERTIQQVCYATGFTNVSNFNRIFKKVTGKTPLAFRQQLPLEK